MTQAPSAATRAANTTATQEVEQDAAKTQGGDFLALGLLRRDTMILGHGTKTEVTQLCKDAITAGRIAAAYVVAVSAVFTEASMDWNEDNLVNASPVAGTASYNEELAPETVRGDDAGAKTAGADAGVTGKEEGSKA